MIYFFTATICLAYGAVIGVNLCLLAEIAVDERLKGWAEARVLLLAILLGPFYTQPLIKRRHKNKMKEIEERIEMIRSAGRSIQ